MNGQILDYSVQKNEGVISTTDGSRYTFSGSEWKGDVLPSRGMWVDFVAQATNATSVYRSLGAGTNSRRGNKSKPTATLLAVFLGAFGAHKFYMGSWGWGIVYLVTFWTYVPLIVGVIEFVHYVLMSDDEFYAKVSEFEGTNPGPFSFFW